LTLTMSAPKWNRKLHRWGAIIAAAPVLVVLVSGLLLQLKKESNWVQPPTQRGASDVPVIGFERVLEVARGVPDAGIETWADIDRLDVRPTKGVIKVRSRNRWELQIDAVSGEILHTALRRSDLIESIHDGSFFHERAKLWVFLPAGLLLFGLWGSGLYLWALPLLARARKRRVKPARAIRPARVAGRNAGPCLSPR
jgi:uncharacterized iron-regulated membrane protein